MTTLCPTSGGAWLVAAADVGDVHVATVEPMPWRSRAPTAASAAATGSRPRRGCGARDTLWRLVVTTVGSCLRYRVTGLAAEAAFFAVLSVPPLIFALAGAIGYVTDQFSAGQVDEVRDAVIDLSARGAHRRRGQQDHRADPRRRARAAAAST